MSELKEEIKKIVCEIFNNIKNSFENHKITLLTIILLTLFEAVVCLLFIEYDIRLPFDDAIILRVFSIFGIEAAFIETYFRNNGKVKICMFLTAAVISGIASFNIGLNNDEQVMNISGELIRDITSRLLGGYLLLILLGTVYCSFKRSGFCFEKYVLKLFSNLLKTLLFYFTLIIGALMIGGITDILLFKGYGSMTSAAMILVTGLYFAPQCLYSLEDMKSEPGGLLKSLVKYVLSCITIVAIVIVYLYMLKIIIVRKVPSNEIFSIVTVLFCVGMPVWLITQYYYDETKYSKILHALPYVFTPLILLQVYSIGIRIYEHGMTPERYMGAMLIVFEIATILIWRFCTQHYEVMIKFLAVLIGISAFVPIVNMDSASNIWQKMFLTKYYNEALEGKELSELEYERMMGAYDYLWHKPQMQSYAEAYNVYDEEFAGMFPDYKATGSKLTKYDIYQIHCCQMVGDLNLNGYKSFSMLNQDESYSDSALRDKYDDRERVDFSNFKFIIRETGEEVIVDISDFARMCIDYKEEHPDADQDEMSNEMKKHNEIEIDADTMLYMNHFQISYYEGIKDGRDYFKWITINISGMMLKK